MKLTFLGGAGTVTGSKYLLESHGQKILIDCGLFQGLKDLRLKNWEPLPLVPSDISAILLTHAHIDHSGYIPRFVKDGFHGTVYCSEGTYDLCKILLTDSGRIQEDDAERANRYGYTKHAPALPLYTAEDAEIAMGYFKPVPFAQKFALGGEGEFEFSFHRAGHILGAGFLHITAEGGTSILFSGDIGRPNDPVMRAPVEILPADYIVTESTYGDRLHDTSSPLDSLEVIIKRTVARGGSVLIPSFAVGRAQLLLYYIYELKRQGRISATIPVYLDSPMATSATELLHKHQNDIRLPPSLCHAVCDVARYTHTKEESQAINSNHNGVPKIIIAASGMATGGRILHHLTHYLGDRKSTILLAGYQAAGTRGDSLAKGASAIKIHGQLWEVAAEVVKLDSMSAHADSAEMLDWLRKADKAPRQVFITHGEPTASATFKEKIETELGWKAFIPQIGDSVDI